MPLATTAAIDAVLTKGVQDGAVPNVVATAADRTGQIYEGAAGSRAPGGSDTVDGNTSFRIMSMTKLLTSIAALQLAQAGKLSFDAPVADYRPEFADLQVLEGFDGDTPRLRAPASAATVKHLITHTSGLGYWFWNADLGAWEQATGNPNILTGVKDAFKAPLTFDPGTQFQYGIGIDWLGQVVETVAGKTLDAVFAEQITGPLGMNNTTYAPSEQQRSQTAPVLAKGPDGQWIETGVEHPASPEFWPGGHGLYSTPRDYLRLQRALLGGGELDGARILDGATVDSLFENQIGELNFPAEIPSAEPALSADVRLGPGIKWSYGLAVNTVAAPGGRAANSGAWAGLANCHYWIDPATGVTGAIFSQTLPFGEPAAFGLYQAYEQALYAALG